MRYAISLFASSCLVLTAAVAAAQGSSTNLNTCYVSVVGEHVDGDITVAGDASPNPVEACGSVWVSNLELTFPHSIVSEAVLYYYRLGLGVPGLNPVPVNVTAQLTATNASPAIRSIGSFITVDLVIQDLTPADRNSGDESIAEDFTTVPLGSFSWTAIGSEIVIELSQGEFTINSTTPPVTVSCNPILPATPFETITVLAPTCTREETCNNQGDCNACGDCICEPGYTGTYCETATCDPVTDCNSHGQCAAGECVCDSGYTGADCSIAICTYGVDCNGARVGMADGYVKLDCTSDPIPCDDPVQGGTLILDESSLTFWDADLPVFDQWTINLGQAVGTMTIPASAFVCAGGANNGNACDPEADPTECPDGVCVVSFALVADPPTTPGSGTFQATYLSDTPGTLDFFLLGDYVCPADDPGNPSTGVCGPLPGEPWNAPWDGTFITTDAQLSGGLVDGGPGTLPTVLDGAPVTYAIDGALICATTYGHTNCNGTAYLSAFLGFSTPTGPSKEVVVSQIYVDPTDPTGETVIPVNLSITYDQIDLPDPPAPVFTTVVTTSEAVGSISSDYKIDGLGFTPVFFDITTNGVVTGSVTVCAEYQEPGPTVEECNLRLLHNDDADPNEFIDITELLPEDDPDCKFHEDPSVTCNTNGWCINPTSNEVCGRALNGLSPFVVAADIGNNAPTIASVQVSPIPEAVGQPVTAAVSFCDPDLGQNLYVEVDWGDDVVTQTPAVAGACAPYQQVEVVHTYMTAGVYTVTVVVSDIDGAFDSQAFQFAVIYDPDGGFVTGGGWIDSPEGAYAPDPTLTGKANFGFVSKYKKGASVPTGNTEFQFTVADLNFKSTGYDWLVIGGSKAKFKGDGTINGTGNFGFMLSAVDGDKNGGDDTFRIKIWDKDDADAVAYDNQMGDGDDADAATVIGGGSIVIHKAE